MASLTPARVVVVVVLIFFTTTICDATVLTAYGTFTKREVVATFHKKIQPISQIQCVRECFKEAPNGLCSAAGYNIATESCSLSDNSLQYVVDVNDEMSGVLYMNGGEYSTLGICGFTL